MDKNLIFLLLLFVIAIHVHTTSFAQVTPLDDPVIPHSHAAGKVLWELDNSKDGDTAHNHMWNRDFGGWGDDDHGPYNAYGCWDNRDFEFQVIPVLEQAHCYVDTLNPINIITYSFAGTGWDDDEKIVVRTAFNEWNSLATFFTFAAIHGVTGNSVGIEFSEAGSNGDIELQWDNLGSGSGATLGSFDPFSKMITFNSSISWDTSTTIAAVDDTKFHFLTVALHEVGHAVGLDQQLDTGDLMLEGGQANPAPDPKRDIHFEVDGESASGAYELYGQTPGQPPPEACEPEWLFTGCNGPVGSGIATALLPGYTVLNADYDVSIAGGPWIDVFEGLFTCPSLIPQLQMIFRAILYTEFGISQCTMVIPFPNCDDPINPF